MPTGIALSGGGSRGDFEVGAIQLLFERGVRPDILTGCSVGALNAAKLAEGPGAIDDLIAIWLDLRYDADMWVRQPWLKTLEPKVAALMASSGYGAAELVGGLASSALISTAIGLTGIPSYFFTAPGTLYTLVTLGIDIAQLAKAMEQAQKAKSVFSLSPIRARLDGRRLGWQMLGNPDDKGLTLEAVANADGRLEAFSVGTANDYWHNWQTAPGGAWTGWQMLGNPDDKGLTLEAVANADGRLEAFSVGTANDYWHNWQTAPGGAWTGWQMLGNPDDKGFTLEVIANADGRLEAFSVGTANDYWHNWQTAPGGAWTGWQMLGNPDDKGLTLTVARNADGRLEAFSLGTAKDYWHNWQTSPGGAWIGESKLPGSLDPAKVRSSGILLRIGAVSLESGALRLVNEHARFVDTGEQLDLIDAVMASASIPVAFPPVKLGVENFIDGGVREMIPVAAALAAGADKVFAITAGKPSVDLQPSFDSAHIVGIARRALEEIMLDEVLQNDLRPTRGWGATVIEITPSISVHDSLLIDPGLIRISMDYGYMRASDIVDSISDRARVTALSDRITETRLGIWGLEHSVSGHLRPDTPRGQIRPVPDPAALRSVRDLKRALFTLVAQRRCSGGAVPAGHEKWWDEFEAHQWEPLIPRPWDRFISRIGQVEKESGPGFLLHTGTALHETDDTFAFAMTDWDGDGRPDLVAIKKNHTGANSTEVHVLSGATNFSTFLLHTGTALHETDDTFAFAMTDWDGDGRPDLVAIKKKGTETCSTEVHVFSGSADFGAALYHSASVLHETDGTFEFATVDWDADGRPDLVAIKKSHTGTNSTEVHIASV